MSANPPPEERGRKRKEPEPDTDTEENGAPSLRQLIPDGDVVLVVGPEEIKIQLSSHLLRSTSPVFNVMLGPNFKEGTLLRESRGPTEIVLPDDNAEALWNVYSTLYGAHPRVRDLGPDEIYDVSILAQKYDLADRLALACGAWFQRADDAYYDSESSFKLLVAAYWLGCESGFAYVSRFLVREAGETIYRQAMESTDQVLGLKLCLAVEELRLNEAVSDESETGLCLSCFKNPKTEKFWIKRDDCPSFYDWVLP